MNSMILQEKIETTLAKAKAVKGPLEKLITKAKDPSLQARRALVASLGLENSAAKMIEVIGPKFKNRPGGYLRIVRIGQRKGDMAPLVRLEFVEELRLQLTQEAKKVESSKEPKIKVRRSRVTKKEKENA